MHQSSTLNLKDQMSLLLSVCLTAYFKQLSSRVECDDEALQHQVLTAAKRLHTLHCPNIFSVGMIINYKHRIATN